MAFATDKWIGTAGADWGAAKTNWSRGFPNSDSDVVISTTAVLTVSYGGGDNFTVHSLTVGNDLFDMSGGTLTITTTASFADGYTQTGGVLEAGGAVTIKGTGTLTGGSVEGHTALNFDGAVALANYLLGGAAALTNAKTTNETGQLTLGDNTGVGARIDNERGAVFAIAGDFGIGQGAASAKFINAGTLEKIAGGNTSVIGVNFVDTGKIVVATGTLEFTGPDNSFAGAISGAGQLLLGAGSNDAFARGTAISTKFFTISDSNTLVTLGGNLSYAGSFALQNSATLDLAEVTLTLSGADLLQNSAVLEGSGALVTAHGGTSDVNGFVLGGALSWQNSGTVGIVGGLTLGDASFNGVTFINERGGIFEFTTDGGIARGAALDSSFVNDVGAVIEKIGGGGDSIVAVDVTDAGAIVVKTTGTIEFEGITNRFAGTISGAGQFALGGGSNDLLASGTTIKSATFGIYDNNTQVALGEKLSYTGKFNIENGATLDLGGFSMTLSGTDTFLNGVVDGRGTLLTAHGSTTSVNGFTLGLGADWQNSGIVDALGTLTIGDSSFTSTTFTNERGGVFDFVSDGGIAIGGVSISSLVNSKGALFEKTSGTGDSTVAVAFTNDGSVRVGSGALEFGGAVRGTGTFTIDPGAVLRFDSTVAGGSNVDFATKTGGELLLADSRQFGSAIHGFGGNGTDEIDLRDINFNSGSFRLRYAGNATNGVLTVTDGTNTAHLNLFGDYKTADFHASADGSGGTAIVDPQAHSTLLAFAR